MIIVTGAYGFIGSNLVHELNRRGYDQLLLVDDLTDGIKYRNLLGARFLDYFDADSFIGDFKHWNMVTAVYHQGAISSTTETDGKRVMRYNYQFSKDLFIRCMQNQIPVSYASSASVYGNRSDGGLDPLNLYAYSKYLVDQIASENMRRFKIVQGWRYFNVYGDREQHKRDQSSPITKFALQAQEHGTIRLFQGSESIYRDFVSVDDVVQVVIDSMEDRLPSGIRDLGTSEPVSFMTVAELIQKKYGASIEIIPFPPALKDGYQFHTRAKREVNHRFTSVEEWLDLDDVT
jgi:ADP-L-glycero-D-manno-heptose 6-epimerase